VAERGSVGARHPLPKFGVGERRNHMHLSTLQQHRANVERRFLGGSAD
jgi:hypothetical protein